MSLLELKDVSKIYGDLHALDHVNMKVEKGEWVAIMGPSGSGKSTMMNIIGCMDTPTEGQVLLDGRDISKVSKKEQTIIRRDKIGLIFQQFYLVNYLTALENVMTAQYYHSVPDEKEAMEALERVGLADRAHHLPSQLSGGEQQRVCVARALINYPEIVLADEPTGNLDEANETIVMDLFRQLHEQGTTLIVVTHDPEVAQTAQRALVLRDGHFTKETVNNNFTGVIHYKAVAAVPKYAEMLVENGQLDGIDAISGATINYEEFSEAVDRALDMSEKGQQSVKAETES